MRPALILVGIVLAVAGLYLSTGQGSFTKTDEVAKVGPVSIDAEKNHSIPPAAGIALLVVGGVMVVVGAMKKS